MFVSFENVKPYVGCFGWRIQIFFIGNWINFFVAFIGFLFGFEMLSAEGLDMGAGHSIVEAFICF